MFEEKEFFPGSAPSIEKLPMRNDGEERKGGTDNNAWWV
jgi:hypothetical protein